MHQRSQSARPGRAATTYKSVAEGQLTRLCEALGQSPSLRSYLDVQNTLLDGWGDVEIPDRPPYASAIGDDHSPYEYSVAFGRSGSQLRILCEAQAAKPSFTANHRAALELTARLHEKYRVDLRRFDQVCDLFNPSCSFGAFSLWHAVMLSPDRAPDFKVYLNPQIRGRAAASGIICDALERLGFGRAARRLVDHLDATNGDGYAFNYFSLDLSAEKKARVKVYTSHADATADDIERAFALVPEHVKGDVARYCDAMVGHRGPFSGKPISSCFAFVQGADLPTTATFHLPIAHYLGNDAVIAERVTAVMREHGLRDAHFQAVLANVPARSLGARPGFQSYASFRREGGAMRLTVYVSPELFSPARPSSRAKATSSFPPISAS